ncbi:MAG: ABC transporter permease subunit [bacterium]|nr:ABC transporter permease subunit [bacterium]
MMLANIGTLATHTFLETVRDRIFYLVAVFGFVMLVSTAVVSPLTIGAQGKIMSDVGLSAMSIFGLLVVVFVGSNMVRKEMDKGTVLTILSKPVSRRQYLWGKFLGLSLTQVSMIAVMGVLFLLMTFLAPGDFSLRYLSAIYLTFLEMILITAVVVMFSTCVSPVLAAVFSLGVFIMGHLSESIRDFGMMQGSEFQAQTTQIVYYIIPNLEIFNVRGAVVHGAPVSGEHLFFATIYGLCYSSILLIIGSSVFAKKELR